MTTDLRCHSCSSALHFSAIGTVATPTLAPISTHSLGIASLEHTNSSTVGGLPVFELL